MVFVAMTVSFHGWCCDAVQRPGTHDGDGHTLDHPLWTAASLRRFRVPSGVIVGPRYQNICGADTSARSITEKTGPGDVGAVFAMRPTTVGDPPRRGSSHPCRRERTSDRR